MSSASGNELSDFRIAAAYYGYKPPVGVSLLTERVPADISAEEFFLKYVKERRPAVVCGLLQDAEMNAKKWNNSYLKQMAGDAVVLVEDRQHSTSENLLSFGTSAPKIKMKYGDFLSSVMKGETRYYMTTQDFEQFDDKCDEDGIPTTVFSEPLTSLAGDYPLHPRLLGKLIPHQLSLWQGSAGVDSRSSSGLHHDFHDNLYVLVRGRKRFRLFPPSAAPYLALSGSPVTVHPNGLIVYPMSSVKHCPVRADGAPLAAVARQKCDDASKALEAAEERLEQLRSSVEQDQAQIDKAEQMVSDCETQLEAAMDEMLRFESAGSEVCEDDNGLSASDDDECDDDQGFEDGLDSLNATDDDEDAMCSARKRMKEDDSVTPVVKGETSSGGQSLPDHFSTVSLPIDDDTDPQTLFAGFRNGAADNIGCLVVSLSAGEMLYLPASWFHEVTSSDSEVPPTDVNEAGHLALNYWMYPPDNDEFLKPYADDFWSHRWSRLKMSASGAKEKPNQ